jgi:hypothetical protein
LLPSLLF